MVAPSSRPNPGAFLNSPYAAELQRGRVSGSFGSKIEAEYVRAHLFDNRTLIRVACTFAVLLSAGRGAEQAFFGALNPLQLVLVGLVLAGSLVLAAIAFSPLFNRLYLQVAQVIVPIRNVLATACIAQTAALGQIEALMLLPLMVIGPFYFMGLRFRSALLAVALTAGAFVVAAVMFGLEGPIAIRSSAFLMLTAGACAIAARHVERWSRTSFLEGHLIEELAHHDTLTGLKNRRVFDERLEQLWQQGIEDARALAILMIDIDHFKTYNDRYGHQAGDQTLRRVAQALQALVTRPLGVLARYGGEEFAVILYDVDGRQAEALAERMRRTVSELAIEHGGQAGTAVTISVGVAVVVPSRDRRSRGALQLADQALYDAKVRGRNRVELLDQAAHRLLVTGVFSRESFGAPARDAAETGRGRAKSK
jgi:diguanylate cyclase (GGDEF)-like protein